MNVGVGDAPAVQYEKVPSFMHMLLFAFKKKIQQIEFAWDELSSRERAMHVATHAAYLIGQFIRIHPFINGNGRISRVIWAWCLARFGVPLQCRISTRPVEPYARLMGEAMRGNSQPLALRILAHLERHPPDLH